MPPLKTTESESESTRDSFSYDNVAALCDGMSNAD